MPANAGFHGRSRLRRSVSRRASTPDRARIRRKRAAPARSRARGPVVCNPRRRAPQRCSQKGAQGARAIVRATAGTRCPASAGGGVTALPRMSTSTRATPLASPIPARSCRMRPADSCRGRQAPWDLCANLTEGGRRRTFLHRREGKRSSPRRRLHERHNVGPGAWSLSTRRVAVNGACADSGRASPRPGERCPAESTCTRSPDEML